MTDITVIGSLNMDLVVRSSRIPNVGETITGTSFHTIPGGKGANQAIAASLAGATTQLIGCVGNDAFGSTLLASLETRGVKINNVEIVKNRETGTATIIVEKNGDNRIIVVPGANSLVTKKLVDRYWESIKVTSLILLQHEIPLNTVSYVIQRAEKYNIPIILNPSPAFPLPKDTLEKIRVLIVNEREGSELSSVNVYDEKTALLCARKLHDLGVKTVIVTLGSCGSVLLHGESSYFQPAFLVDAIDTTAAGDTFVGVFAATLITNNSYKEALLKATAAAALAVTKLGAQTSIPSKIETDSFIKFNERQEKYRKIIS